MDHSVVLYTSPTCGYCVKIKKFFASNDISFEEKDVLVDESARKKAQEKSGQLGVPVTIVDDKKIIIGYDEEAIKEALGI